MRPAALVPADGPVRAVQHELRFFIAVERPAVRLQVYRGGPERKGHQDVFMTGPVVDIDRFALRYGSLLSAPSSASQR